MIPNELPRSLQDNPRPADWITFEADGTILLATGKVELGQGILTALVQLAAEELCVSFERIRPVSGDTRRSPEEIFTSGSQSVEVSGGAIRIVCAELRRRLLDVAAGDLHRPSARLDVVDGHVVQGDTATGHDYWTSLDRIDMQRLVEGRAPLLPRSRHRILGQNVPRLDLPGKVYGSGFIHDVDFPGTRHARVLRGPVRGAILVAFDEDAARQAAPVEVIRRGRFVALVGPTEHAVNAALHVARERAEWKLPAMPVAATDPHWLLRCPSLDRVVQGGPIDPAADERLTAVYSRPFLAHASIAPSCALAHWDGARLTVLTHSQGVGPLRTAIARVVGLDPERVAVIHRHGAGCYGQNGADDVALDAAVIALAYSAVPIRVLWTRADEMSVAPFGSAMAVRIGATIDPSSRPRDWQMDIWSCSHGRRPGMGGRTNLIAAEEIGVEDSRTADEEPYDVPDQAGGGGTRNAVAPYDLPQQRIAYHLVRDQPLHTSSMRALGAQANVLAIESFMDELADRAGVDPLAYRLALLSDVRMRHALEAVAGMCGWAGRGEGGLGTGLGLGVSRYKNRAGYAAVAAEVEVDHAVRLRKLWCAVDAGLVVNPDGVASQIEGGMVQAASWTLKEQVLFDDTGVTSASWDTYPILRFSELPEIAVRLLDPDSDAPLGVGEIVVGPTTAAIANAVAHALGFRLRDLPFTRERIMSAMLR